LDRRYAVSITVAIGNAPNGYFMREAARIGRRALLHISDI